MEVAGANRSTTTVMLRRTGVSACSLRSQRRLKLVAQQETFASRIVVAVAVHVASRRWLPFLLQPGQAALDR